MDVRQHWESVYECKSDAEVSWTQNEPRLSMALIGEVCRANGRVIDVGAGTSPLVERLLDAGFSVAVLDISAAALERARSRVGERGQRVEWIAADVTAKDEVGRFDVWHDRAVFHFLTEPSDRAAYVALLTRSVSVGGHAVMATFALDGPEQCSGLPVERYDGASLANELGAGFALLKTMAETHVTPWGDSQSFQYSLLRRV
jgi:2-polyprenyl-3-methyl-5-hydroxy-6-metoxy-1,4-benzoquinol methylase